MGKNKKKNNSNNDEISDSHIENEIKNTEDCISTDVKQGTNGIIDLKQSTSSMDKKKQKKDKSKKSLDKKNTTEQASTETEEVEEVEVVLDDETDLEMEDETQEPSEIIISKEKYDELIKQIEDANKRYEELFERFQRVQADFENYKKYLEKEKQEAIKYASGQLIRQLLNIIDDFERAINSMGDNNNPVLEGIRSIYRNFYAILEKEGLKPIECTGKFDPFKQECLLIEERDDCEDDEIIEVLSKGYMFKDKILRPAMVKVAKKKKIEENNKENVENKDLNNSSEDVNKINE